MNCRRAEELFSDERESALAPPIARELSAHLDTCDECQDLYRTFQEIADALEALSVPAPPDSLKEKLLADLVRSARTELTPLRTTHDATRFTALSPRLVAGASWLAVAAVLAMVLLFQPPDLASEVSRKTSQTARHVYSFVIRTYDQTERWIEDLKMLRMTVGVAFEDRLDQLNERLRDLEDASRRSTDDDEQSQRHRESGGESEAGKSGSRAHVSILSEHSSRSLI